MSDWLLVIDMQPAFGHPESPWFVPDYEAAAQNVSRLVKAFDNRVLFTRFVPPTTPEGSWRDYYREHPFALDPQNEGLWALDPRWEGRPSVASHRFSKWHEVKPKVPAEATLVLCGVATDCCVLGTAIDATEDGRKVRIAVDACRAATEALHTAGLAVLADRAGLVELSDTARETQA